MKSTEVQTSPMHASGAQFPAVSAKWRFHGKLITVITFELRSFSSISMLILFPVSSAFCWYLTLAFRAFIALARAVTDTQTHRYTDTHTQWLLEPGSSHFLHTPADLGYIHQLVCTILDIHTCTWHHVLPKQSQRAVGDKPLLLPSLPSYTTPSSVGDDCDQELLVLPRVLKSGDVSTRSVTTHVLDMKFIRVQPLHSLKWHEERYSLTCNTQ